MDNKLLIIEISPGDIVRVPNRTYVALTSANVSNGTISLRLVTRESCELDFFVGKVEFHIPNLAEGTYRVIDAFDGKELLTIDTREKRKRLVPPF